MSVYLYVLRQPFSYKSQLLSGVTFHNKWVTITPDGTITISAGYAWDGCSPKWKVGRFAVGVPDGPIQSDGYPQTAWASLVHDAVCQFKTSIQVTKRTAVRLFDELLRAAEWLFRPVYVTAVNLLGPQRFAGDH